MKESKYQAFKTEKDGRFTNSQLDKNRAAPLRETAQG